MKPRWWLIPSLLMLAGLSAWLWTLPGDGDPWPPGKPHPRTSGTLGLDGRHVQFPPLAETPRLTASSVELEAKLQGADRQVAEELLGPPDERIGDGHACWWSVARYAGDTGDTGWRQPVVHLLVDVTAGRISKCRWFGGGARELGVPVAPPPPIPAGLGPPDG